MYSEIREKSGINEANNFTSNIINFFTLFSIVVTLIGIIFSEKIVSLIGSGFQGESLILTIELTRIMFPAMVFLCMSQLIGGILQCNGKGHIYSANNIPLNILVVSCLVFFRKFGIYYVTWTMLIGYFFQILFQIPFLKCCNYTWRPILSLNDKNLKKMTKLMVPVIIGTMGYSINLMVDRSLASNLPSGSIAALNFSSKLNFFVFGLISVSISIIIYPLLSKLNAKNDLKEMKFTVIRTVIILALIILPITFGTIALKVPMVKLLYERGEFNNENTLMTASALLFYSFGMFFYALRDILSKIFYSLQDTKTPMWVGCLVVLFNIGFNLILIRKMGHNGLALGTTLASFMGAIFMLYRLNKTLTSLLKFKEIIKLFKVLLSAIIMGVLVYKIYDISCLLFTGDSFTEQSLRLGISIILGIIIYIIELYILKIQEFILVIDKVKYQRIKGKII